MNYRLNQIETKLAKLADAIESVGIDDTLANRLGRLAQEKAETKEARQNVKAPVKFSPDVIPALVQTHRELVLSIESLGTNPHATLYDVEAARACLRGLLGTVTLKPRD